MDKFGWEVISQGKRDLDNKVLSYAIREIWERRQREEKWSDRNSHFLLKYLKSFKRGKGKISPKILKLNGINSTLDEFMKHNWAVDFDYVKVIEKKDVAVVIQLEEKAYLFSDDSENWEPKIVKYGIRLKTINVIKTSGVILFKVFLLTVIMVTFWLTIEIEWLNKSVFLFLTFLAAIPSLKMFKLK